MLFLLALTVLLTTLATEWAARRGRLDYWVARKLLHFVAVSCCAVAAITLDRELLTWIVGIAEVGLLGLITTNRLMREESGRRAWGIVWFPLAFLVLLLSPLDDHLVAFAMLVLAVCDPAATVAGKLYARRHYALTGDRKSYVGNAAFLLSFLLLLLIHYPYGLDLGWPNLLALGLLLTLAEALGSRGLDNLLIPLGYAFLVAGLGKLPPFTLPLLVLAAVPFAFFLVRRGSLTGGGAGAAVLLGVVVVFGMQSWWWLWPLFFFLASSSLIGRLLPAHNAAGDDKQNAPRDATQVLANGAVYGTIAALLPPYHPNLLYLIMPDTEVLLLVAMAVATADTWSSQIGQYFRRPTYDLLRWRQVPPGLSGGISGIGTLAGLAGSAALVAVTFWLLPDFHSVTTPLLIVAAGFFGMLLDSLLGALLQARYTDVDGTPYDTPAPNRTLTKGYAWATNDLINFLAIALTVLVFDLVSIKF